MSRCVNGLKSCCGAVGRCLKCVLVTPFRCCFDGAKTYLHAKCWESIFSVLCNRGFIVGTILTGGVAGQIAWLNWYDAGTNAVTYGTTYLRASADSTWNTLNVTISGLVQEWNP